MSGSEPPAMHEKTLDTSFRHVKLFSFMNGGADAKFASAPPSLFVCFLSFSSHPLGDVGEAVLGVFHSEESLVGGRGGEGTEVCAVGTDFHVVKNGKRGGDLWRKFACPGVPPRSDFVAVSFSHCIEEFANGGGVVVASHESDAGDFAFVGVHQCEEAFFCQFLSRLLLQIGAVAAGTAVGAAGEIDGKCDFVRKLLEDNVVVHVGEHKPD